MKKSQEISMPKVVSLIEPHIQKCLKIVLDCAEGKKVNRGQLDACKTLLRFYRTAKKYKF